MIPRQPQTTSSDPGQANSPSGDEICRRYIWGTCTKHTQCIFRHELDIEKMKDILQFCHDYQNRNGCTRENCKYLHATKEEQTLFLATGQVPRVLAERHAAMAAAATNMTNAETIPQIAMFISESYMTQPPPAPWPPLPPPQAGLQPVATAPPPPPPASPPRHAALQPIPQAQQPPPPPAQTPASTPVSVHQIRPALTTYPALPTQNPPVLFPLNQPPPMVPANFDASRPPPPIPTLVSNNQQLKRKVEANGTAGPTKIRKPDGTEASENLCESCVQRELRIDGYKLQMETLHNEEETQILLYKKKLGEYETGREMLKTLVGPELFRLFDDLIEGTQTPHDSLSNINSNMSFASESSTMPIQALLQLFGMLINGQRNIVEPVPSTSRVDETLQSLTSLSRSINMNNYSNPGPDLINLVAERLRNNSATERSQSLDVRTNESPDLNRFNSNRSNGLNHLANGQRSQPAGMGETVRYGAPAGYSGQGVQNQEFGSRAHQPAPNYAVAGPSGYSSSAPAPAPPLPAGYAMFHPAIPPPPNRHYYGQTPIPPNGPNMPSYGADRAAAPGPTQAMQPSTSAAALRPGQSNAPNYNYMGRYPQQPYFPPFQ